MKSTSYRSRCYWKSKNHTSTQHNGDQKHYRRCAARPQPRCNTRCNGSKERQSRKRRLYKHQLPVIVKKLRHKPRKDSDNKKRRQDTQKNISCFYSEARHLGSRL